MLAPKIVDRLVKLGGMTGSSHGGEALNALRLFSKLMNDCDLTWDELIRAGCGSLGRSARWKGDGAAPGRRSAAASASQSGSLQAHMEAARWALQRMGELSEKEHGFLRNMARQAGPISARQQEWLDAIVERPRSEVMA